MILIISADEDVHAQAVMREMAKRGRHEARMLNLSEFPMRVSMNMRLDNNGHHDFELRFPDKTVRMEEVTSVWWRRPQPFGIPPEVRDPAARHFAMSEAATAENVVLALEPIEPIAVKQTITIRANITAYSTAVGPSSETRKRCTF